jgi:hypothetical protein
MGDYSARINGTFDVVVRRVRQLLESRGLQVSTAVSIRGRDVPGDCRCPHHGTDQCDCQYLILTVSGTTPGPGLPRLIAVHGHAGQTWLSLLRGSALPGGYQESYRVFETLLVDALAEAILAPEPTASAPASQSAEMLFDAAPGRNAAAGCIL